MFFAVSTGGGLESIFVEEGREDDTWVKKRYNIIKVQEIFKPNQKPTLINNSESEFYPAGGGGGGHAEKNVKRVANIAITSGCAAKNIVYPSSHRASRSMSIAVFAQGAAGLPLGTRDAVEVVLGSGLQGVRGPDRRLDYVPPRRKQRLHGVLPCVHRQGPREHDG